MIHWLRTAAEPATKFSSHELLISLASDRLPTTGWRMIIIPIRLGGAAGEPLASRHRRRLEIIRFSGPVAPLTIGLSRRHQPAGRPAKAIALAYID